MLCFYFTRVLTCPRHSVESAINECIWFRLLASISLSMTHSFSILRTHVLSKAFLYSCSSIIILLSRSSLVIEPVGMFVKYKKSFIFVFLVAYTVIKFSTSVHFEADLQRVNGQCIAQWCQCGPQKKMVQHLQLRLQPHLTDRSQMHIMVAGCNSKIKCFAAMLLYCYDMHLVPIDTAVDLGPGKFQ